MTTKTGRKAIMGGFLGNAGAHWWIILIIVVLVFGAAKLPALARSLGQSVNILKKEVKGDGTKDDAASTDGGDSTASTDRK
ncbi:twin-arginine translocase TatA/TatE family subunit [Agrococcus baldri]|uniref:twin-arginine translocase TatA/TatE family subunit n=1 Tax=Agrococcus baldri TaxID=153730 RepID=UPI00296E77B4|nr:twin-arginine translocase TatA/TatE family subunit [Agrococcus baldri]